jgi:hypothetical protein
MLKLTIMDYKIAIGQFLSGQGVFLFAILFVSILTGCEEEAVPANPFEDQVSNQDTVRLEVEEVESATIAGIYQNAFKPTCANVGCHDGTFEPDFRTLESAYNTLVYQEPIKNDGRFDYRVDPGSVETSVIMARLNNTLSPPMPIQLEPDSDWFEFGDDYIEDIRTWIENGALDIMGQEPSVEGALFRLEGAFAMQNDSILRRFDTRNPLRLFVDSVNESYLYFALSHTDLDLQTLEGSIEVGFSRDPDSFENSMESFVDYLPSSIMHYGYDGVSIPYHFRVEVHPEDFEAGETYYMRLYLRPGGQIDQEIPSESALFHLKKYYSIEWIN